MRDLERLLKALANRNRIRILTILQNKPMCVCEIRYVLGISQPSVSRHLHLLKQAGLVEDVKSGPWVDYRVCRHSGDRQANVLLRHLQSWTGNDAQVKKDRGRAASADRTRLCRGCR